MTDGGDDLDAAIADGERVLEALYQRRRERDDQALLLAILRVRDDWFCAREVLGLTPARSSKALGRWLHAIAARQAQRLERPPLRLVRHKTTTAATVWKIESYLPACGLNGRG